MPGLPDPAVFRGLEKLIAIPDYQRDPGCRDTETITENFTGAVIGNVPRATEQDTLDAIARAREAQKLWAARSTAERARVLRKFNQLMLSKREDTLDILQAETGKSRAAGLDEVVDCSVNARYYANHGPKLLRPKRVRGMLPLLTKTVVLRKPKGVVGIVSPWNYPLTLAASDALPALMAGNAVVIKPDSQTPYSAMRTAQLLYEAGLPRDVFQVVTGRGSVVGSALADNAGYLMFTGSSKTGKILGAQTGGRLIGYSAELGGKNAMIVEEGANLKRCADVATRTLFANAGQLCISVERVYVERAIYDEFVKVLTERLDRLVIAADYSWETEYGSIISQHQLEVIENHIKDAVSKGATVLYGGKRMPEVGPLFFQPTLLANVPKSATVNRGETFGPLCSIYPVDSIEQAIHCTNDTEYGLNSSVWGKTWKSGEKIAAQLNTGTVAVNEGYAPAWESIHAPMGGHGISGVGRRHGEEGLLKYTETTTVATQRLVHMGGPSFIPHATWQKKLVPLVAHIIAT